MEKPGISTAFINTRLWRDVGRTTGKFKDVALDDAERTPRKLNQFNHVKRASVLLTPPN
jgi:hypothetical protein